MKKAVDDELRNLSFRVRDLIAMERIVAEEKRKLRNDTIEECARAAQRYLEQTKSNGRLGEWTADILRALKEKP